MYKKKESNKVVVPFNEDRLLPNHKNNLYNKTKACLKIDDQLYNALTSESCHHEQQQLPKLQKQNYSFVQHNLVKKTPYIKSIKRYSTKFWFNQMKNGHDERKKLQISEFERNSIIQNKKIDSKVSKKPLITNSFLVLSYIDEETNKLDHQMSLFMKGLQSKNKKLGTIREVDKMRRSMIAKSLQIIRKRY